MKRILQSDKRLSPRLLVGIVAIAVVLGFGRLAFSLSNEKISRTAVSWDTQLSAVRQAAQKVNADALLYDVWASVEGSEHDWDPKRTLNTVFYFVTPQMQEIDVRFVDSDPQATLRTDITPRSSADLLLVKKDQISSSIGSIAISPRDAIQLTWGDASVRNKEMKFELFPIVSLDRDNIPAVWSVSYVEVNGKASENRKFVYRVDAKSGTILSTEVR